ncbi:nck-associated protein 5-like [Trichomycterus rosablanca]|uniref:nck-associated protein 5-like n=1 Tax=Trichomycterus rosablanca TaxID=2290929 RepID=UPI002F35DA77
MSGSAEPEMRECDEAGGSVEGDTDLLLEEDEEDEDEDEETESNKELLERFRELEAENASLALANESQREAYERCLDEVANHVVQALLNQKDLREECIKLKMRVFELERQNRTLTDIITQKLQLSSTPLQQLSSVWCVDEKSDPSITGGGTPHTGVSQEEGKKREENPENATRSLAQASSSSSMDAMSPFLRKKAHILEVLRKLEEEDPLKFHPSPCYHLAPLFFPGEMVGTSSGPHQHHCRHSSSDPEIHERARANSEGAQREENSSAEGCSACSILQQKSSLDLLRCNQGTGGSPQTGTDDGFCQHNSRLLQTKSEDPKTDSKEKQSNKTSSKKTKDSSQWHQDRRKSETLPTGTGGKAGNLEVVTHSVRKKDGHLGQVCKGDSSSYRENSISKKVALAGSYSSASLPERSTSAFANNQGAAKGKSTQGPCSNIKPQPSASKLLKLLKEPSENVPKPSKIPCRNNYELHRLSITSQKNTPQSSAVKTDTYPGTHSAPTSPPNPEDTSTGYSTHSAPKPSKASKTGAQVPHYENIDLLLSNKVQDDTASSDKSKSSLKSGSTPSSESSTSTSDSSSSSSDQDSDTESPVLQRPQHHFSLPTSSSAAIRSQRISYPCTPDRYHERLAPDSTQMISGTFQVLSKGSTIQATLPRKTDISSNVSDLSYHPFKDRLAALGKLKKAEDLQQAVSKASASSGNKTVDRQTERKLYLRNTTGNYAKGPVSSSTTEKRYITKTYGQKIKMGTLFEAPVVMRNNAKYPNPNTKTVPSPHCSSTRVQSKSPSKAGSTSSYPRGTKPVQNDRTNLQKHQSCTDTKPKPGSGKKKTSSHVDTFPPPLSSRSGLASANRGQEKRTSTSQSIEQRVMRGIEENVLKDKGQEAKQKASSGIASWFGLKKSKLPALNRKPGKLTSSPSYSGTKDTSGAKAAPKMVVESLNISKLMEKAEDLRKALEDEKVYVRGVGIPLDRPARGRSCEVMMDTTQGHLSLMYTGLTSDSFMQQLLTSVDESGSSSYGFTHRRLSFDSKKSNPVFGHQKHGVRQTRSGEEMGKCAEIMGDDITSNDSLAKSISSQHFKGSRLSMRTLDSGIGTFPLPECTAAAKFNTKLQSSTVSQPSALKVPRKSRTLERELASVDELHTSALHTSSPIVAKGTGVHLSGTTKKDIDVYGAHLQAPPTTNWKKGSEPKTEPVTQENPSKQSLDRVPQVPRDAQARSVPLSGSRKVRRRNRGGGEALKDGGLDLIKEQNDELLSPNRPHPTETPESLSDSLYDSLSSCGSQG